MNQTSTKFEHQMSKQILDQLTNKCCQHFDVSRSDFFSKKFARDTTDARQLMFYCAKERGIQIFYISKYMLDNGMKMAHSTISHGIGVVSEKMERNEDYVSVINNIQKSIFI